MAEQDGNKNGRDTRPRVRQVVPFYGAKIGDLVRPLARVRIRCWGEKCDHVGYLDTVQLVHEFGPHLSVKELRGRNYKCSKCGCRMTNVSIEWIEDPEDR